MKTALIDFCNSLKELCFPAACLVCNAGLPCPSAVHLCDSCRPKIELIKSPLCKCCGREFLGAGENHLCGNCLSSPRHFTKARSVLRYNDETGKIIHSFKYSGKTTGRQTFSALMSYSGAAQDLLSPDLIIPVPLHVRRLRERGFNQALLLARFFYASQQEKIVSAVLERSRWTAPQTGLSGLDRRKNLKGAFMVNNPEQIKNKKIVLVDDVYTTGTTLDECARVLKKHGAREVQALTLARAAGP